MFVPRFVVSWIWICLLCVVAVAASPAQTFKTVVSFDLVHGAEPQFMSLVEGSDRKFYGTTFSGSMWGDIFTVTADGQLAFVCDFEESDCPGGAFPFAGLTLAADGNFYGTAWQGNASGHSVIYGDGTVFEMTAAGQPISLYSFCSQTNCADGGNPFAPVMQAADGRLYGTTVNGGAKGYGTVYAITTSGTFTALHSFRYADGAGPVAGLIQAKDGNFYGTTLYGGAHDGGTVFQMTPAGKLKPLHSFGAAGDGANPYAALMQASDGNFYGTTHDGGAHGHGTVFRITASGKLTTLYSFCSQKKCADGAGPFAGLIQATDGNLYGTASKGGAGNWGALFAITPAGQLTTLYSFCTKKNCVDGADPLGGLLQASDGNLYGTTAEGGTYQLGTVFRLSLGADQLSETLSAAGDVAADTLVPKALASQDIGNRLPWFRSHMPHFAPAGHAPAPVTTGKFSCSPAPCVLPPTQVSQKGGTDPLIVSDPLNQKELLLGGVDGSCPGGFGPGFRLSRDGGSTWELVNCMPGITYKGTNFDPGEEASVAYDKRGGAYAADTYSCTGYHCYENTAGLVAVQRSSDGTHWGKTTVALRTPGDTFPFETSMAIDTSASSPWVNSVYVSAVMWSHQGRQNQIMVSHSSDGGKTWKQAAIDAVQKDPERDNFTRMAVDKDGTAYVTWLHCRSNRESGLCPTVQMTYSKSVDGGNTWSTPQRMATVQMPKFWLLPNTQGQGVSNYPVIATDNSNGPHSGNLYVAMYAWAGTHLQAQVIRSSDGGKSWSKPVPVAPPTDTHDQFFTTISISPTGLVGVSWLDRRNDPGDLNYQAFAAISADGGKTFKNWQLTKAFSNPDDGDRVMGDYMGNTWVGDSKFIAAWMDSNNLVGVQEVIGGIRLK